MNSTEAYTIERDTGVLGVDKKILFESPFGESGIHSTVYAKNRVSSRF
jgi:hypothetical protein